MITFFYNLYKNDPIQFFMMIAIIYLLLKKSNVIENLKSDVIDLTAASTASQLAQKINKALSIDTHGNVTFKKNVTNNGNVTNNRNIDAQNIYVNRNLMFKPVNQQQKGYTYALYGWDGGNNSQWLEMTKRHNNKDPKSQPHGHELQWQRTTARLHHGGVDVPYGNFSSSGGIYLPRIEAGQLEPTTGHWGGWGGMHKCPNNQYVCGGQGRIEGDQGGGDDTMMNGMRLKCCKFA